MDRVLIVDGSVQTTGLMRECLNNTEYEVMTSESGLNALAKVEHFHPDLVILSDELPDMSGFDLCKRIKTNPENKYVLVLMMSLSESTDSWMRALSVQADDFMQQTFDSFILISKVNALMRLKHLSDQLKNQYAELEEKNNILDFQMKMGKSIQRSMMPNVDFAFNHMRFYSRYMPAMDIGGDLYDIIPIDGDRIAVVIGDVSGHGIAAALLTSMLILMIKNLMAKDPRPSPDVLLKELNEQFFNIFEHSAQDVNMYACVFCAVINTKEQRLYYANAGHPMPTYINAAEGAALELESSGLPIGMMPNAVYEGQSMSYWHGDWLLFHTDGLSDNFYKDNPDEFSARLKEVLVDNYTLGSPAEIADMILNVFYNYNASETEKLEQDDVSIVLCKM